MALALYRKYRPATFAEVVGQDHVTVPLRTALGAGRVNHAYLFSGPRGCGKTSCARIMARSLNCAEGPTDEPCGRCDSCVNLAPEGPGSVDVIELDAASHGGVDDARELRDRAFYSPAESRYRVFVIDEAHMVTPQGFNALLKIVEEPPEHLIFIFATTEPEKVMTTIRSRTHHYPFRLIPPGAMRELLERNAAAEGTPVEPAVYPLIVRAGGGSARDTQSVLDQLLAGAGPEGVTYERAIALLGFTDSTLLDDMVDALSADDSAAVFGTVERLSEAGHDPRRFATDLLMRLRDLVLLRSVPDAGAQGLVAAPEEELAGMEAQANRIGPAALTRYAEIVHNGLRDMRGATAPRLVLELLCARMLLPAAAAPDDDSAVLHRLERVERRVTAGAATAAEPAPPARVESPDDRTRQHTTVPQEPQEPHEGRAEATQQAHQQTPNRVSEQVAPQSETQQGPESEGQPDQGSADQPTGSQADTQAQTGTIDATAVRGFWSQLLAVIRKSSRSTEAMLTNATVHSVDGDSVVLSHTAEPLARRLAEPRNADAVAAALHEVLGGTWQVTCVHAGADDQQKQPGTQRQAAQPPHPVQAGQPRQTDNTGQPEYGDPSEQPRAAAQPPQPPQPPQPQQPQQDTQVQRAGSDEPDVPLPEEPGEPDDGADSPGPAEAAPPEPPQAPGPAAREADAGVTAHQLLSDQLGARPLE